MKNELGIEVCCENCKHYNGKGCTRIEEDNKSVFNTPRCWFLCDIVAYSKRIIELQEQLEISENAYHKSLDAYHDVAEQLEELKARSRK